MAMIPDTERQYPRQDRLSRDGKEDQQCLHEKQSLFAQKSDCTFRDAAQGTPPIPGEEELEFDIKTSLYIKIMHVLNVENTIVLFSEYVFNDDIDYKSLS